jgi:sorbitol-specific phosphotransferase system component IIC
MLGGKRVVVAPACGALFGIASVALTSSDILPNGSTASMGKAATITYHAVMGFMLGISAVRLRWWLHDLFVAFVASIPVAASGMDRMTTVIAAIVIGMLYGLLTELITSVIVGARSVGAMRRPGRR